MHTHFLGQREALIGIDIETTNCESFELLQPGFEMRIGIDSRSVGYGYLRSIRESDRCEKFAGVSTASLCTVLQYCP